MTPKTKFLPMLAVLCGLILAANTAAAQCVNSVCNIQNSDFTRGGFITQAIHTAPVVVRQSPVQPQVIQSQVLPSIVHSPIVYQSTPGWVHYPLPPRVNDCRYRGPCSTPSQTRFGLSIGRQLSCSGGQCSNGFAVSVFRSQR